MTRIAAIDQGTTSTRVLIAGTDGALKIVHSIRHAQHFPQSGWVEHDPLELLRNIRACLDVAGDVDAIGIDNQGESCMAWDAETGDPLSPVIVWQDNRTAARIEQLRRDGAEATTLARAGLPLDAYFSASKLGWIVETLPAARAALAKGKLRLGTTDSFFLDRLAGTFATDPTTASRTSLMNFDTLAWDPDLCRLFGVPIEALPTIRPTAGHIFGCIGKVAVTASVVDQQAALYGHGCRAAGDAKVTFGTGAFVMAVTGDTLVRDPAAGLLPTVAWQTPDETLYALDGGVYDAGSAIEWLQRIGMIDGVAALQTFAECPAIDDGLVFVPALSGLGSPFWDRSAAGLWIGMTADTSRQRMAQAVLEGIALSTAEVIAAIGKRVTLSDHLSIDGGLSRSAYFSQFLSDTLGRTVLTQQFDERTSFGCAALAGLAIGLDLSPPDDDGPVYTARASSRGTRAVRFRDAVQRSRAWR